MLQQWQVEASGGRLIGTGVLQRKTTSMGGLTISAKTISAIRPSAIRKAISMSVQVGLFNSLTIQPYPDELGDAV